MQEQNIPCRRNKIFSTRRNIPCRSSDNFFDATRSRNKIFLSIARLRHDCFGTANHRREDSSNVERRRGGRIYLGFWIWKSSGCNRHCSISTRLLDCVGGLNFGSNKDVRWCCWTVWRRMLQVPWSSLMSSASPDRLRKIGIIMQMVFEGQQVNCYLSLNHVDGIFPKVLSVLRGRRRDNVHQHLPTIHVWWREQTGLGACIVTQRTNPRNNFRQTSAAQTCVAGVCRWIQNKLKVFPWVTRDFSGAFSVEKWFFECVRYLRFVLKI